MRRYALSQPAPDRAAAELAALEPVRAELLRAARADADTLRAQASREAAALLDRARAEAQEILGGARQQGAADGAVTARAIRTRAHRAARTRRLTARREAYAELRDRATMRVRALRHSADYPTVLDHLASRASRLLGSGAQVTEDPAGGVLARAAGRHVDCTLDALAARALDRLGGKVQTLWEP